MTSTHRASWPNGQSAHRTAERAFWIGSERPTRLPPDVEYIPVGSRQQPSRSYVLDRIGFLIAGIVTGLLLSPVLAALKGWWS